MNKDLILQCSLFSHFDNNMYFPEYVLEKALMCKRVGVSVIHVHLNKFKTIDDFLKLAHLLEVNDGPLLNISANDVITAIECAASGYKSIACAAMQGGSATIFGNTINQTIQKANEEIERLLQNGIIPEISVFNFESIGNCIELYNKYGKQFYVGVYMGYPGGMVASISNVESIMDSLNMIPVISFTIYNNQDDELIKHIVEIGGHLRSGLEDSLYCGNCVAIDSIDIMMHYNRIIAESGTRRVELFDKESLKDYLRWS